MTMPEAVQVASLIVSGLTMISLIGGVAAVFIKIGRREEQIDHLARAIQSQSESTQQLNGTLRAIEILVSRLDQSQRDHDRRLTAIENGGTR